MGNLRRKLMQAQRRARPQITPSDELGPMFAAASEFLPVSDPEPPIITVTPPMAEGTRRPSRQTVPTSKGGLTIRLSTAPDSDDAEPQDE